MRLSYDRFLTRNDSAPLNCILELVLPTHDQWKPKYNAGHIFDELTIWRDGQRRDGSYVMREFDPQYEDWSDNEDDYEDVDGDEDLDESDMVPQRVPQKGRRLSTADHLS